MRLGLIGVPFNSAGSATSAEAAGPGALRAAGLVDAVSNSATVTDYGDLTITPVPSPRRDATSGVIAPETFLGMVGAVRAAVKQAYSDRLMPLLIGGDSAILLGGLLGARDQLGFGPGLLFVDGHEDAYPPFGSVTGEACDMELGLALGVTRADHLGNLAHELPVVQPHEVALLGCRDGAELKAEGIESVRHKVIVMDDSELRDAGVAVTITRWLDQFQNKPGRFWFHLDLDVLSTDANAAVSYPQPGGLAWDEVESIVKTVFAADHLIGIDIDGYNPDRDRDQATAHAIVNLIAGAIKPADSRTHRPL